MGNWGRQGLPVALLLAFLSVPGRAHAVVTIEVGWVSGHAGEEVFVPVVLHAEVEVSAAQNDLDFGAEVQFANCTRNEAIGKEATTFAFRPTGCERGVNCDALRAIVVSFENVGPIPDGSTLYTCRVRIGAETAAGSYPLLCSSPVAASPPVSVPLETTCLDGEIEVLPPPQTTITIGSATAAPGEQVLIEVSLAAPGVTVVAAQNDVIFPPDLSIESCTVNAELGKDDSAFNIEQRDCEDQMSCDVVRALVLSLDDVEPIADGALLYSCVVTVSPDAAPGPHALRCDRAITSDANAVELVTECTEGSIDVLALCAGDCNGNGNVPVDELITGVNIALGRAEVTSCTAVDGNANGNVSVDELVLAVIATLDGC